MGTLSFARTCAAALFASAAALVCAPAALADATNSTNWAGYAVHGAGATYKTIEGSWRQPSANCTRGVGSYSSYWVGLGGYSQTSQALEQIGTEIDCGPGGDTRSTAWYELVPAAATGIQLAVHPGDQMTAGVTVSGRSVSLSLYDVTRKQGFTKTLSASIVDVTSAEWIVEAPSDCVGQACQILPLADFGTAAFTGASVVSGAGRSAGINDPTWQTTKIKLLPTGRRFFVGSGATSLVGAATPTAVAADNHSFKVSYSKLSLPSARQFARISATARPADLLRLGP